MAYRSYARRPVKKARLPRWLFVIVPLVIIGGILYWLLIGGDKADAPSSSEQQTASSDFPAQPAYTPIDLQPTVDAWAAKQSADYHIVVHDLQAKQNIAVNDAETTLFAASLYKIYVAYLALLDIQNGDMNPSEIMTGGQTRKACIDKMIRSSDSPCGEAMMADMGPSSLNQRVQDMGMTGTYFNGIRTSAADSARIVQYIAEKRDLNDENTAFLLDAMLTQDAKFKRGLATGALEATWQTKVGWNEDINYHDIGIMTMPDGRKFAVAILGQGSGSSKPIADFAKTIYDALVL